LASHLPDGVLVIDKPPGLTSHDVVARVRRLTGQARAGHTGTLDPMATGVLPLVLGRATRLARFFSGASKSYAARVRFGWATTTFDAQGERTWGVEGGEPGAPNEQGTEDRPEVRAVPERDAVERALSRFVGHQEQTPPAFSAKKIGGVPAHRLARRQRAVVLAPVPVQVEDLRLQAYQEGVADLTLTCSAGFYVRALAHDLGVALGCGAHLVALRRTRSGEFHVQDAIALDAAAAHWGDALRPLDGLLAALPAVLLRPSAVTRVRHGRELRPEDVERWVPGIAGDLEPGTEEVRVLDPEGRLLAIAQRAPGGDGWPLHPGVVLA
jgi:tRNA pseudouridine55 synthase